MLLCHEGKAAVMRQRAGLRAPRDHGNVDPTAHPIENEIKLIDEPDASRWAAHIHTRVHTHQPDIRIGETNF